MTNIDHRVLLAVIAIQNEIAASALELGDTMTLVCDRAMQLTGAAGAAVEIAERDEMVYRAASGAATDHLGVRIRVDSSLSGLCVRAGQVLVCADTREDPRVDAEAWARAGALSMVCVPLSHRGTSVGVLKVYWTRVDAFDAGTVETLELLSSVIVAHLSRANNHEAIRRESRHDALTGLGNRSAYEEQLRSEVAVARRHEHPLSLCLLDIDGFKRINDRYGQPAGDEALRRVAQALKDVRAGDYGFRVGGDEFALLLPHTDEEGARTLALRVRNRLQRAFPGAPGIRVSIGVVGLDGQAPADLHADADAALYEVKRSLRVAA